MEQMLRLAGVMGVALALQAQAPTADEPVTLHAYANLVQIPVLVLSDKRLRAAPLSPNQFSLSIDSGPRFAPRHVRREGDDPIRLVILLDVNPNTQQEIEGFGEALRETRAAFTEADVVSVSVENGISLAQTEAVPVTTELDKLASTVSHVVATAPSNSSAEPRTGQPYKPLLDAVDLALTRFGNTRSRRILLVVTNGEDHGSRLNLKEVRANADALGVTIFALREQTAAAARRNQYVLNRDSFSYARTAVEIGDPMVMLTEATGGMTLETRGHPLAEGLHRILRLTRERYLVDFVRPSTLPSGVHTLDVRIRQKNLFVHWGGIGLPMVDPRIALDPTTVPSDRSAEPPVGTRKVLPR